MKKSNLINVRTWLLMLAIVSLFWALTACSKVEPVTFVTKTDEGVFDSSQFEGDVIYVDFWASWCVPCRASFPWMNDMLAKYSDQGLQIIAITLDQDTDLARLFAEELKAEFTIGYDLEGTIANQFGVRALPSSVLISRKGALVGTHTGFNETQAVEYEEAIVKALGKG